MSQNSTLVSLSATFKADLWVWRVFETAHPLGQKLEKMVVSVENKQQGFNSLQRYLKTHLLCRGHRCSHWSGLSLRKLHVQVQSKQAIQTISLHSKCLLYVIHYITSNSLNKFKKTERFTLLHQPFRALKTRLDSEKQRKQVMNMFIL